LLLQEIARLTGILFVFNRGKRLQSLSQFLAQAAHNAAEFIGWPEARIPIAEATIYIATANKSNTAITSIDAALADVKSGRTLAVPQHLRDKHYAGAKRLGHGENYQYAHDHPNHFVPQDYLGAAKRYYEPTDQGVEKKIKDRVEKWREQFDQLKIEQAAKKAKATK
jgi:putative ATPase